MARLLHEFGPAERRHWELFHRPAARHAPGEVLASRWERRLAIEADLTLGLGTSPTVDG